MFNHRSCFYIYILEQFISNAESNVCFQRLTLTLIMQHWSLHLSRFLQKAASSGGECQTTGAWRQFWSNHCCMMKAIVSLCKNCELWSFGWRGNCHVSGMLETKIFELFNVTVTVSPVNSSFCRVETHFSEACLLNIFSNVIFASKLFAF